MLGKYLEETKDDLRAANRLHRHRRLVLVRFRILVGPRKRVAARGTAGCAHGVAMSLQTHRRQRARKGVGQEFRSLILHLPII